MHGRETQTAYGRTAVSWRHCALQTAPPPTDDLSLSAVINDDKLLLQTIFRCHGNNTPRWEDRGFKTSVSFRKLLYVSFYSSNTLPMSSQKSASSSSSRTLFHAGRTQQNHM